MSDKQKKTLTEIFASHPDTDKGSLHSYDSLYEELLSPYRDRPISLLEVGARRGASLLSWADYFDDYNLIVGLDNGSEAGFPYCSGFPSDVHVLNADTTKPNTVLESLYIFSFSRDRDELSFDIIIDDGCHHPYAQCCTFGTLSTYLSEGGIYIVEDIIDISFALRMKQLFGGEVYDRREVKQRHDDIVWVWRNGGNGDEQ